MHNLIECEIGGFGEINTTQDYGTGVVRINRALGKIIASDGDVPARGSLWCIETRKGKRRFALLRNINEGDRPKLWMEYEDRRLLGVSKKKPAQMSFRPARRIEYFHFLWSHTDPLVLAQFRVAVFLTFASLIAGVAFGAIFT